MDRVGRKSSFAADERAVTVAITHVLTVGIATVLITGLLFGAGTMLDTQREASTEASLEVIGERLAGDVASVDRMAEEDGGGFSLPIFPSTGDQSVTVRTDHQRVAGGSGYTVELYDDASDCEDGLLDYDENGLGGESVSCIQLHSHGEDVTVSVPIVTELDLDTGASVTGGPLVITVTDDDEITLEERS